MTISLNSFKLILTTVVCVTNSLAQVQLQPSNVTLGPSGIEQFTVQSGGTQIPATWSIYPPQMGSISSSGLYTAPTSVYSGPKRGQLFRQPSGTAVVITATGSLNGASFTTSATVYLSNSAIAISLTPTSVSLAAGKSQTISATVS